MADADIASNPVDETSLASPTFSEAFDKASSTLQSRQTEPEEPPQPEPVAPKEEPAQEEKPAPPEPFDPEKLPPELKPLYFEMKKNMDKGFTQGRQKDRAELNALRKELESLKSGRAETQQQKKLTPEEFIDQTVEQKVREKRVESFRDQALSEYNSLDPRLTQSTDEKPNEKYDPIMDKAIGTQLDQLLQDHLDAGEEEWKFDYKAHGKRLVAEWDAYLQKHTDGYLAKQRDIAKKQERTFQKSNPQASAASTKPSGAMSLEQAVNAAYRKHQSS
jgi:hypothetical protein